MSRRAGPTRRSGPRPPTAVADPDRPTPSPRSYRPTPTPEPTFALYTVKRGDTLVRIAKRFKTSGRSIAYWNRVTYPSLDPDSPKYQPDRLELGWVLQLLPGQEVDPEDAADADAEADAEADARARRARRRRRRRPGSRGQSRRAAVTRWRN